MNAFNCVKRVFPSICLNLRETALLVNCHSSLYWNKQGAEAQERSVVGKGLGVGSTVQLQKNAGSVFLWFNFSFPKVLFLF